METINILNGRVVDPASGLDEVRSIHIAHSKIAQVGGVLPHADLVLHADGMVVAPGFIDLHVHLRTPGQTHKEDLSTGLAAAAAGGFTCVVCMPNTNPALDCGQVIDPLLEEAAKIGKSRLYIAAAVTKGREGKELSPVILEGHAAVRAYSDDGSPVGNSDLMQRALEITGERGGVILAHCEDSALAAGGILHPSAAQRLKMPPLSPESEITGIQNDITALRCAGKGRLHIQHVSAAGSVDLIRKAKQEGLAVTAEAAPHHFALTAKQIPNENADFKMNPPLRDKEDQEAVITGLTDGTLDVIATDHAPHAKEEKSRNMLDAPFGIIGLETALPLAVTYLLEQGKIDIARLVNLFSVRPAEILGIEPVAIKSGNLANLTIFAINNENEVDSATFRSKARNCPFNMWKLKGQVMWTLVGGRIVFEA